MSYVHAYILPALQAAKPSLHLLPPAVVRGLLLAESLIETRGVATADELRDELGNWVIARRTEAIVAQYGEDVNCISPERFDEATRSAIEKRADRLLFEHTQNSVFGPLT